MLIVLGTYENKMKFVVCLFIFCQALWHYSRRTTDIHYVILVLTGLSVAHMYLKHFFYTLFRIYLQNIISPLWILHLHFLDILWNFSFSFQQMCEKTLFWRSTEDRHLLLTILTLFNPPEPTVWNWKHLQPSTARVEEKGKHRNI